MPLFGLVQKDNGFDPPYGSHQFPAFLKFSVRVKLPVQLVHMNVVPRSTVNTNGGTEN